MSQQQVEQMFKTLVDQGSEYALKATQLSSLLEKAEAFLQKIPGKIHTTVSSDEFGGAQLMYHRNRSDEWRLVIYVGRDDFVVSETNVENKARAAALLPDLIDTMLRSKDERLQMVNTALERLHSIPFLKDIPEKEGK